MSIDLLHLWPSLLGPLGVVVATLMLALWRAANVGAGQPWLLASAAALFNVAISMAFQPGGSLAWHLVSSAVLVGVPVVLGSPRAVRLRASGVPGARALAGGLLLGLGIGWLVLPILLLATCVGVLAITR